MKHMAAGVAALLLSGTVTHAQAQALPVDLPAGSLGEQVAALGHVAHVSIVVPDPQLWSRRMPALRGRMTIGTALRRIAVRAHANLETIGSSGWRLRPAPPRAAVRKQPRARPRPAAPPPPPGTDEIVVTASKRDTTRDHFPGQIERVAGAELERGGAGGTDRLVQRLTSVTSTYLGAGRNKLFIRGIADSSFTGPTQATVGQYYGDLRLSYNAPDPDLRLSDLAAVEVLEGPQGTLYGAGSLGGIIRLVPNAVDTDKFAGSVTVGSSATTYGQPGTDTQAMVNLPLSPGRLAVRIVANASIEGGYIDKSLLDRADVNRTRIIGGRATAHLVLAPDWTAEVIGIGQRIRGADSQYADRDGPMLERRAAVTEGFRTDYAQGQFILSGRIGDILVRSTNGITAHDLLERYDATPPAGQPRLFTQSNRTRMQANETRAWRTRDDGSGWLVGASYIHNATHLTRRLGPLGAPAAATGVVNSVTEWTAYGEASLRLLEPLLLTGGVRATRSELDGRAADVPALVADSRAHEVSNRAQTVLLPAVSGLFDVAPNLKLFARYQQGFRPGGLAIEGDFVRKFRNDRVATIELGARHASATFDAAFTVARAAWRDIQADFIDGTGLPSTANIGNGRVWTINTVVGVRPLEGLRLESAVAYNDGRIDEPSNNLFALARADAPGAEPADLRQLVLARLSQIPNIAKITARAGAVLQRSLRDGELTVDGWLRYVGSSRLGVGPVLGQRQGSYLDTELNVRMAFARIGVGIGVSNLLDTRGNRFALGTPFTTGRDQVTPLRPRTLRIGINTRF